MKFFRRALMMLIFLLGGLPTAQAAEPRIAALSWEPVEHLLKLGVEPVAVADADDYRAWVVRPKLPASAIGVGTRTEPNLELLAQLDLDLILITPLLEDLRPKLERIAPVVSFGDFTQERDNLVMQRENYLELAHLLGRTAHAQAQLAAMEAHIAKMRGRLLAHFGGKLPDLSVVRFSSPTTVLVFGPNSMPKHAMQLLGLRSAHPVPVSRWGNIQMPVAVLGEIEDGAVLHIEPFPRQDRLFGSRLWQAMPFVRQQRFADMRSTWTHGGVFCVEYLAESITEALLSLPSSR